MSWCRGENVWMGSAWSGRGVGVGWEGAGEMGVGGGRSVATGLY